MALRKTVTPPQAMTESGVRTVVDLLAGWVITLIAGWIVKQAANNNILLDINQTSLIVFSVATTLSAVLKRKFWPTKTDNANVGRTDLPAVPPAPLP